MKQNIKKILPYVIFFALVLFLHMFMNFGGDDIWFAKQLSKQPLLDFLNYRYYNWSSRVVIEALLVIITRMNINIWRIIDTIIYTISAYCIIKFSNKRNNKGIYLLGILLVLMYPYEEMSSAGWGATTLNYAWCLCGGLLALLPLIKEARKEKVHTFIYIIGMLGLLYAANQEQSCALLFGFNSLYLLNTIIKNKTISKYNIISLLITIVGLVFIITCPGNSIRVAEEITQWYPAFENYGIIQKIYLGTIPTLGVLINNRIILSVFYIILSITMTLKTKNKFLKCFAFSSIIIILSTTILRPIIVNMFPRLNASLDLFMLQEMPNLKDKNTLTTIFISTYFLISSCLMLYIVYGKKELLPIIIFIAGFMSRAIMGFSPTVFASGPRTAIYFNFALIALTLTLISKLYDEKYINNKWDIVLKGTFIVLGVYSYISTFIAI